MNVSYARSVLVQGLLLHEQNWALSCIYPSQHKLLSVNRQTHTHRTFSSIGFVRWSTGNPSTHKRGQGLIYPAAALLQGSWTGEAAGAHHRGVEGSRRGEWEQLGWNVQCRHIRALSISRGVVLSLSGSFCSPPANYHLTPMSLPWFHPWFTQCSLQLEWAR